MKILPYNIVISPPADIQRRAIATSKLFQKEGALFSLGVKNFIPHVTIYLLDLPAKNEQKVINALKTLAKKTKPLKMVAPRYRTCGGVYGYRNCGSGYTDVAYKKSKSIAKLQMEVIKAINPLREGIMRDKYGPILNTLPKYIRNNVKKFGFSDVGKEYYPHLTLTRLSNNKKADLSILPKQDFSFTASKIAFYHRGEHGTCKKLIAKFNLSAK